jgi:heme/copper-type cytochrome/quinol oxidase subunit 4
MILLIILPFWMTAAAVSSQEDSIARIFILKGGK